MELKEIRAHAGELKKSREKARDIGLELESQLYLAEITARGALAREESRGSHYRVDYPGRNDSDWLRHTVARLEGSDPILSYTDVDVSRFEPRERTY